MRLPQKQYSTQAAVDAFNASLIMKLQQLPGAFRLLAVTSLLPASGQQSDNAFVPEAATFRRKALWAEDLAWPSLIMGDYLHAAGIPLLRGREFTAADNANSPLVLIVNRTLVERYWPGQ